MLFGPDGLHAFSGGEGPARATIALVLHGRQNALIPVVNRLAQRRQLPPATLVVVRVGLGQFVPSGVLGDRKSKHFLDFWFCHVADPVVFEEDASVVELGVESVYFGTVCLKYLLALFETFNILVIFTKLAAPVLKFLLPVGPATGAHSSDKKR